MEEEERHMEKAGRGNGSDWGQAEEGKMEESQQDLPSRWRVRYGFSVTGPVQATMGGITAQGEQGFSSCTGR